MKAAELAKTLHILVKQERDTKKVVSTFLQFMEEKNMIALLPNVVKHFEALQQADKQKEMLSITVSQEHAKTVYDSISSYVEAGKAEVDVQVDDSIMGGFIALYNNTVYDASVKNSLAHIKKSLLS
ncbi:MAG: F0F1 ATP synthase subunit delta [Patescibacteria group bacterium]